MAKKQIRVRCWVEIDGDRFFGPGPAELLRHIEVEGSLSGAAKKMRMSYKKAWDIIEKLNSGSRNKFVQTFKGGNRGGRAEVTPHGKRVVARYQALTDKLNRVLDSNEGLIKLI